MRHQLVKTVANLMERDESVVLLLGDIGVWGFRDVLDKYTGRAFNIGILEQSMIGVAAGLSLFGMTPIVHSIAPFLVERAYEQLKLDFGYQKLGGNFVSVGASYDYSVMGCTHHCPADVAILKQISNFQIVVPGTPEEFDKLFLQAYNNGHPTYFRLSEYTNVSAMDVEFGVLRSIHGSPTDRFTVLAVGPALDWLLESGFMAEFGASIHLLYCTTVAPFDVATLLRSCESNKLLIVEPYYEGGLLYDIISSFSFDPIQIECVGFPHRFLDEYNQSFLGSKLQKKIFTDLIGKGRALWNTKLM